MTEYNEVYKQIAEDAHQRLQDIGYERLGPAGKLLVNLPLRDDVQDVSRQLIRVEGTGRDQSEATQPPLLELQ